MHAPRSHTALAHLLLALFVALGLVATACGDDEDAGDATTTEAADDGSSDDTSDTSDPATGSADEPDDTTGGGSGGTVFTSDECEQLSRAFDQQGLSSAVTGTDDPTDDFKETAQDLRDASGKAPEEIADDIATLAELYEDLAEAAESVDWEGLEAGNPAAAIGAARLGQVYADHPEFTQAAQNLSAYAMEHCTPN